MKVTFGVIVIFFCPFLAAAMPMDPSPTRRALVIVDMSVEQMAVVTHNAQQVIQNCKSLALNDNKFFDLCMDCKLWLHSPEESSLSWVWPETATTMFVAGSKGASLIPELRGIPHLQFIPKNNCNCFANSKLLTTLREANIHEVYICGINTDYCVFATAMGSFEHKFKTFIITDAVTSNGGRAAHNQGLRNLEKHFSSGVFITTNQIVSQPKKSEAS
jgi:nicotinamidase-related amidase